MYTYIVEVLKVSMCEVEIQADDEEQAKEVARTLVDDNELMEEFVAVDHTFAVTAELAEPGEPSC